MYPMRSLALLLCAAALAVPLRLHAQSASELFQQALRAERVAGDLEGAIRLYRQVVELDDRQLAARALLRIGASYERLGREGGEEAYHLLVTEYADQSAEAGEGRVRLAALRRATPEAREGRADEGTLSLRLAWADAVDDEGRPTPDGRSLIYVDWFTQELAVRDLASGRKRLLTNHRTGYPLSATVSNDGRSVAYHWIPGAWEPQLRVVGIDGTADRALIENATVELDYIIPSDWTPDDLEILTALTWMDGHESIAMVSATDGSIRTVRSLDRPRPLGGLALSPDGRWIAYASGEIEAEPQSGDIFILASDGSAETRLTSHPAHDRDPVWTPDGRHLLFWSDRSGRADLWSVRIVEGAPQGEPFVVQRDLGHDSWPLGFTAQGDLFFSRNSGGGDIYEVDFDPASGRIRGTPQVVVPLHEGRNTAPSWARDAHRLAYLSRREPVPGNRARLIVRDESTGTETEPVPDLVFHSRRAHPQISPRGNVIAAKSDGLRLIDLAGGDVRTLTEPGPTDVCAACVVTFSRDGRALYYATVIPERGAGAWDPDSLIAFRGLVRHDLASDTPERLFAWDIRPEDFRGSWAVSPDETKVAYLGGLRPEGDGGEWLMRVGDLRTGGSREIVRIPEGGCTPVGQASVPAWTPDGGLILYVCEHPRAEDAPILRELMSVPASGGTPRSTGLVMEELRHLSMRPDGSLGFAAGPTEYLEVWSISGLLTAAATGR